MNLETNLELLKSHLKDIGMVESESIILKLGNFCENIQVYPRQEMTI